MAVTFNTHSGDGTTGPFSFTFEYIDESDVKVSVDGTTQATTAYTFPTASTIQFVSLTPSSSQTIRIFRDTDIDDLKATFFAGSSIRAQDLNNNFEQNNFAVQEIKDQYVTQENGSFSTNVDMNSNRITDLADPVNAQDAVTKQYLEDNYFDDGTETITSGETWPDNDTTIATTAAVDNLVDSKIDTAIEGDVLIDATGLTKNASGGQVTLGIGAGSVDLDRIKDSDIITSAEANPNNDTTIATTAKIDDMIDAAITGDIAVDSTGLTVTDDGDGTITLGIGAGSVDLDRISAGDIITYAEQNAGPTPDDDSIFTSSAASRRFDTLVQTGTPSGSDWETGKTWLQNDDDQTLKIWNGSTWLDVASGGSFRTQDKVIYVDATGGDDSKTGHRISGPKLTIKEAINDINADIDTSIKTAGSGYTDGTYNNVPLTGGTTGSGLTATVTVTGGVVTAVTNVANSTLQDYQIGDILSAADSNLGGGGGSGFELEVTGGGDGMTVIVSAGDYAEIAPIQIKRRNVSIVGMALRSTIVHPTSATQGDHADGNNALFELNSGSFIQNLTLTGVQAGTYSSGDPNTLDPDLPKRQGWNFAFYNNCVITKSPYIQNCTNFSDSQIVNTSSFNPHNPAGGQGGDLTNAPTGGGLLVDGAVPHTSSPLRSMVCDSYTHVGLNGPGILVTNNGYLQATSSYAFFNKYHIKARNGGQANLAASTTDFGEKALVADGKSTSAIFTASVNGAKTSGSETFDIDGITAGSGWFGDANIPATNMLVTVNSVTYPILEATAITGGYRVKISRPNANNRSLNDGLNGDIADDAAVSFFLRSQIASSGHTMEYVGSGMDYDALPENGGVPDETKQITELNNGKIWTAITDHNGKFKIGGNQTDDPIFEVDQQLGFITIPTGSIAFDLLSDTTPQLGADLDVNGSTITGLPTTPTVSTEATSKAYVDAQVGAVSTDVVNDTTPQLGGNLDVNGNEITSASNGNVTINPNGTGNIELRKTVVGPTPSGNLVVGSTLEVSSITSSAQLSLSAGGTANISASTHKIINVVDPTDAQDAATKNYVDTELAGISSNAISQDNSSVTVTDTGSNGTVDIVTDNTSKLTVDSGIDLKANTELVGTNLTKTSAGYSVAQITGDGFTLGVKNNTDRSEIRFLGTTVSDYVGFRSPGTFSGQTIWNLPSADGSANQILTTDGSGTLSFADAASPYPAKGASGTNQWAVVHSYTVDADYSIPSGSHVINAGPMTVNSGVTVTIPTGSNWTIV